MKKNKFNIITIVILIFTMFVFTNAAFAAERNEQISKQVEIINKNFKTPADVLKAIDKYQEQYFEIVKRNNVLISYESEKALNKDRKELKKLYKTVKKQIANKSFIEKYNSIEKQYSKCDASTTPEMNEFAYNYYNEVDVLLNEVYKEVQSKISSKDFEKLVLSEINWLKDVESYKEVFDSMEFGTIGTVLYYDYQTNMRQFRTLLLLLYL